MARLASCILIEIVQHREGEYVRGEVHTNSVENFWSLLKRGVMGTYHNVSKKYLPLYLNEFTFRFNNRKNPGHLWSRRSRLLRQNHRALPQQMAKVARTPVQMRLPFPRARRYV